MPHKGSHLLHPREQETMLDQVYTIWTLHPPKKEIFAFVKFVPFFTTQVSGIAGLKILEGWMVPLMHNWMLLGHNHIKFCLAYFIFASLKWPSKHGIGIFELILLEHLACLELWMATWDLGLILAMCKSMGKFSVYITWPRWGLDGSQCNTILGHFGVLKLSMSRWWNSLGKSKSSKFIHLMN